MRILGELLRTKKGNFEQRKAIAEQAMVDSKTVPLREIEDRLGIDEYDFGSYTPSRRDFKSRSEYRKHYEEVERRIGILTGEVQPPKTIFQRGASAMRKAFKQ